MRLQCYRLRLGLENLAIAALAIADRNGSDHLGANWPGDRRDMLSIQLYNNNNNNNLIYIAPECRMTSEVLADSSSGATEPGQLDIRKIYTIYLKELNYGLK